MRIRRLLPAVTLIGLVGALLPSPAHPCATCSCGDPTLTSVGQDIPFAGRLRAYTGLRLWTTESHEGTIREARLDLVGTWSPAPWLVLGLGVPLQLRGYELAAGGTLQGMGAGDLQLTARALVFRDRAFSPNHLVSVFAGLEVPTATLVRDADGGTAPLDAQLGSGSWDPLFGAGYAHYDGAWSQTFDVRVLLPTQGFGDHREGMSVTGALAAQYQPWTWLGFRLGAETRFEGPESGSIDAHHDPATSGQALYVQAHGPLPHGSAGEEPVSGGWTAFASPGVVASPMQDLVLQLSFHLPVVDTTQHKAGPVLQFGATVDF